MSDVVGNPKDRLSRVAAHLLTASLEKKSYEIVVLIFI